MIGWAIVTRRRDLPRDEWHLFNVRGGTLGYGERPLGPAPIYATEEFARAEIGNLRQHAMPERIFDVVQIVAKS